MDPKHAPGRSLAGLAPLLLAACAAAVPVEPASLMPLDAAVPELRMAQDLPLRLSTAYARTLPAGSRWSATGRLPQGTVYRPVGTVFSIEGRQVHEAYLVVQDRALRGFYLPAEARFSPLPQPVPLPGGETR